VRPAPPGGTAEAGVPGRRAALPALLEDDRVTDHDLLRLTGDDVEPVVSRFDLSDSKLINVHRTPGDRLHEAWERSFDNHQWSRMSRKVCEENEARQREAIDRRLNLLRQLRGALPPPVGSASPDLPTPAMLAGTAPGRGPGGRASPLAGPASPPMPADPIVRRPRRPAAAVIGLLIALVAGCGDDGPPLSVDTLHDLVARVDEAVIENPRAGPLAALHGEDHRDGVALLHLPAGTSVAWHDLAVGSSAHLEFAVGSWYAELPDSLLAEDTATVAFRVEGLRSVAGTAAPDQAWSLLWEQRLRPADLPASGATIPFDLPLPGEGAAVWALRFSTAFAAPLAPIAAGPHSSGQVADWPAVFAPLVRSGGRTLARADHPVHVRTVALDLIEALPAAERLEQSADDPVRRDVMDAAHGLGTAGGSRPVVRTVPPARVRYAVTPEPSTSLEFAVGVDTQTGWTQGGDGLVFAVEVDGERVWERTLDPANRKADIGWKPVTIDLARWAGRRVDVDLVTDPRGDAEHDTAGWSDLVVLQRDTAPRLPEGAAPHVIVVVVDTLRADRLGAYGGPDQSPRIDALAAAGRLFRSGRGASSWTWPSTTSILTGLYPNGHGVQDDAHCLLLERFDTLPELFMRAGYTTGAFITNPLIATDNNFHQGFESFAYLPGLTARALNERVRAWLEGTRGTTRFAYLHYFDPHMPYAPPPEYWPAEVSGPVFTAEEEARLHKHVHDGGGMHDVDPELAAPWLARSRRLYDAEIAYFDTAFGELLDLLGEHGVLDDALVAFTSDHGEEFLEHGYLAHGPQLYEETVKVPLILTGFGRSVLPAAVVEAPVETIDIVPTLLRITGVDGPAYPLPGRSMLESPKGPAFAQSFHGMEPDRPGYLEKRSIVSGTWKLIHTPAIDRVELYDLQADPRELDDLAARRVGAREGLLGALQQWNAETRASAPDNLLEGNTRAREKLVELGYVGDG
jgi:arylsulfatase A-like enzyme